MACLKIVPVLLLQLYYASSIYYGLKQKLRYLVWGHIVNLNLTLGKLPWERIHRGAVCNFVIASSGDVLEFTSIDRASILKNCTTLKIVCTKHADTTRIV